MVTPSPGLCRQPGLPTTPNNNNNNQKRSGLRSKARTVASPARNMQPLAAVSSQQAVGFPSAISPLPFPTRLRNVPLRFSLTGTFATGTAGVVGTAQLIRLNSLFDPDQTGAGHQPTTFDVLTPMYSKYLVRSAEIIIIATTIGGSQEVAMHAQVFDNDGFLTFVGVTCDAASERMNVATAIASPSGNARASVIRGFYPIHKIFGVSETSYLAEEGLYSARFDANPSKNCGIQVAVSSPSATAGENLTIQIMVEYRADFFEPFAQAQS